MKNGQLLTQSLQEFNDHTTSVFKRLLLNMLPLVATEGRKSLPSRREGEQSLFIFAGLRCLNLLSRLHSPQERHFIYLFIFYKAGAKRHKAFFFLSFFLRCLPIHVKVQSRMLPPFLVFGDELGSAGFLGRPPTSCGPLGGGGTAAEGCVIGGRGVEVGESVCRAASGSAVMNRRWLSTVSQPRSRYFFLAGSIAA